MSDNAQPVDDYAASPSSLRQAARLEDVPALYRQKHERLAVELALHVDDAEDIFARYGYDPDQAAVLVEQPAFLALMQQAQKAVVEEGLGFRTKAKLMAGELLPYAHDIATDPLQSSAVRLDAIKWTARVAGFEPKDTKEDGKQGGGLTLNIQFSGSSQERIVSAQDTLVIEQS